MMDYVRRFCSVKLLATNALALVAQVGMNLSGLCTCVLHGSIMDSIKILLQHHSKLLFALIIADAASAFPAGERKGERGG